MPHNKNIAMQHSGINVAPILPFITLRDVFQFMTIKSIPECTLERKKREALALKANIKKRKEQAKLSTHPAKPLLSDEKNTVIEPGNEIRAGCHERC